MKHVWTTLSALCLTLLGLATASYAAMSSPTNLSATSLLPTKYQISWTPPPNSLINTLVISNGTTSYQIRTTSSNVAALIPTAGTWTISVQGRSVTELSPVASTTINVTITAPSTAVSGVTAVPQSGGADLRWNAGTGTDTMQITYVDPVTGLPRQILSNSTFAAVRNLQNDTAYTFTLAWINSAGTGPSTQVTVTPTATRITGSTTATAVALTSTSARVSWAGVPSATFYAIYAGPSSDLATLKNTVRARITSSTQITISPITTDWYAFVFAGNKNGLSSINSSAVALPTINPPADAPDLTLTPGVQSVAASWTYVSGAANYNLFWNQGTFDQNTANATTSATSPFVITGLTENQLYAMAVRGTNGGGPGPLSTPKSVMPISPQTGASMQVLAAGWGHSLAIRQGGVVAAWGNNTYGQLGDGTTTERLVPITIPGLSGIVAVAAGEYYSLALKNDGTVYAFGRNEYGQLGDGTTDPRSEPYQIPGLTDVIAIASGGHHSLALKADGTVLAWGRNTSHEVSPSATTPITTPTAVSGLATVLMIAATDADSYALLDSGVVWAFGNNAFGNLGQGHTNPITTPVQVPGLTNVAILAAGGINPYALKTDGKVWSWGYQSTTGAVGDGTLVDRHSPVQVTQLTNILDIGTGLYHAYALDTQGRVWGWGVGNSGQLGNGTLDATRATPSVSFTNTHLVALAKGSAAVHSMGMLDDWRVITWGNTQFGQVGNGLKTPNVTSPYTMTSFTAASSMSVTTDGGMSTISFVPIPGATNYTLELTPMAVNQRTVQIEGAESSMRIPVPTDGTSYRYSIASGSRLPYTGSFAPTLTDGPAWQISSPATGVFYVPSASFNSQYATFGGNPVYVVGGTGLHPACLDGSGNTYDWSIGPYPDATMNQFGQYNFQGPSLGVIHVGAGQTIGGKAYNLYVCHIMGTGGSASPL